MNSPAVLNNEIEKNEHEYEKNDNGECIYEFKKYFKIVKIKKINYKEWDESRINDNLKKIKMSKSTIPIKLRLNKKKFDVIDGNHRCYVCNLLGYTHIPSYVIDEKFY